MSRRAVLLVTLCLAFCAGCADRTDRRVAPPPPRLTRVLAEALASQSDEIAQALEAHDACRASSLARVLQARTIAAINARNVPGPLQEPLAGAVTDLASRITCAPPAPEGREHGKKKGKGKHKGEGGD